MVFKGVLSQTNGKWGAQIYAKQKRIWLGTFNSEREAAHAYDRASIKLRCKDGHRNYPNAPICETESDFQGLHTDEEIVQMIKDHSYDEKLEQMKHRLNLHRSTEQGGPALQQLVMHKQNLFQKEMTVSDVGSQNRLVVPKQHALRHFPTDILGNDNSKCLTFFDCDGKKWQCSFKYWKSSKSYVLTKGWRGFVKHKKLEAGDIVSFDRDSTMAECTFNITVLRSPKKRNSNLQSILYGFHPNTNSTNKPTNSTTKPGTDHENSLTMSPTLNSGLNPNAPSHLILDSMPQVRDPGAVCKPWKMPMPLCDSESTELLEAQNPQKVHSTYVKILADEEGDKQEPMNEKTSSGNDIRLFGVNISSPFE